MSKKAIAAIAALCGITVGGLASMHLPALAAGAAASSDTQLADRIAVEDLINRYAEHYGEPDSATKFAAYYTEDMEFVGPGDTVKGREAFLKLYTTNSEINRRQSPAPRGVFRMVISNPVVEVKGNQASVRFLWTGIVNTDLRQRPQLWEQGRECDLLVKQDGKWLIRKRTLIAYSGLPERHSAIQPPCDVTLD